jgi:hypothetical protein
LQVGDLRQRYATNSSAMSELAASSEAAVARLATSVRDPLHSPPSSPRRGGGGGRKKKRRSPRGSPRGGGAGGGGAGGGGRSAAAATAAAAAGFAHDEDEAAVQLELAMRCVVVNLDGANPSAPEPASQPASQPRACRRASDTACTARQW